MRRIEISEEKLPVVKQLNYDEQRSVAKVAEILDVPYGAVKRALIDHFSGVRDLKDVGKINARRFRGRTYSEDQLKTYREGWKKRSTPEYRAKIADTKKGIKNHQAKLTDRKVTNIRKKYTELLKVGYGKTEAQHLLAKKYAVKRPTISDIVNQRTWKHLLEGEEDID